MATLEIRASVLKDIASILNNDEAMIKLQQYVRILKKEVKTAKVAEETISKKEILAGIKEGLEEVKKWNETGEKRQTLKEFIDEL